MRLGRVGGECGACRNWEWDGQGGSYHAVAVVSIRAEHGLRVESGGVGAAGAGVAGLAGQHLGGVALDCLPGLGR